MGGDRDRELAWARPAWLSKVRPAFHAAWTDQPNAEALLAAVASDHDAPAFARASALSELAPHVSTATNLAEGGLSNSGSDRPDRRTRHAGRRACVPDLVGGFAPADGRQSRRAYQGCGFARCVPTASQPLREIARNSSVLRPSSLPPSGSTRTDRSLTPASETSMHGAALPQTPKQNIGPLHGLVLNTPRQRSISPISIDNSVGIAKGKASCAQRSLPHREMRGCTTQSV